MPMFCGIDGAKQKLSKLYGGVDGAVKPMKEFWAGVDGAKRKIFSSSKKASDVPVGSIIKIPENGVPVEYLVVHQGLPSDMYDASCAGTWVLRKDILEKKAWNSFQNDFETASSFAYLNSDFLSRFSVGTSVWINGIKLPYVKGGGYEGSVQSGPSGLECKIFLLSIREVGISSTDLPGTFDEGVKLDYFLSGKGQAANALRSADYNGKKTPWYSRTPARRYTNKVFYFAGDGMMNSAETYTEFGIRPAFILSPDTPIDGDGNIIPSDDITCGQYVWKLK